MPAWVAAATADYLKRMPPEIRIELCAVKAETRGSETGKPGRPGKPDPAGTTGATGTTGASGAARTWLAREAQRIRAQLPPRCKLVVLDERGEDLGTQALAQRLAAWQREAAPVAIVIGGPDGIDAQLRADAHQTIRLSSLTLPHALVRVLLAEQLYRAWSINAQHPYHRE